MERAAATTAIRLCMRCRTLLGLEAWPPSGKRLVVTHGLCDDCAQAAGGRLR